MEKPWHRGQSKTMWLWLVRIGMIPKSWVWFWCPWKTRRTAQQGQPHTDLLHGFDSGPHDTYYLPGEGARVVSFGPLTKGSIQMHPGRWSSER